MTVNGAKATRKSIRHVFEEKETNGRPFYHVRWNDLTTDWLPQCKVSSRLIQQFRTRRELSRLQKAHKELTKKSKGSSTRIVSDEVKQIVMVRQHKVKDFRIAIKVSQTKPHNHWIFGDAVRRIIRCRHKEVFECFEVQWTGNSKLTDWVSKAYLQKYHSELLLQFEAAALNKKKSLR